MSLTLQAYNAPGALDETQTRIFLRGKAVFTATTYAAGGILPVSYTSISDASGAVVPIAVYPSATIGVNPDEMLIFSESGSGFVYQYVRSTGKVMIFTGAAAQSALTELANGALPAGVIADIVRFIASWPKQ